MSDLLQVLYILWIAGIKVEVGWPDARPVFPTVSLSDAEFVELNIIGIDIEVLLSNVGRLS